MAEYINTPDNDNIIDSTGDDIIRAGSGNDEVFAGSGDDIVEDLIHEVSEEDLKLVVGGAPEVQHSFTEIPLVTNPFWNPH